MGGAARMEVRREARRRDVKRDEGMLFIALREMAGDSGGVISMGWRPFLSRSRDAWEG